MKKLLLMLLATVFFTACNKDDQTPGNSLPEATQTSAGTFACYVDGNPYIAKKSEIIAYYQYTGGFYTFGISSTKKMPPIFSIILGYIQEENIIQGETYTLKEYENDSQFGGISFVYEPEIPYQLNTTNGTTYKGEMTITKLDMENQIISGTFWFDVQDPKTGETREVRDGRFDVIANF